jgi:hypothetical protein
LEKWKRNVAKAQTSARLKQQKLRNTPTGVAAAQWIRMTTMQTLAICRWRTAAAVIPYTSSDMPPAGQTRWMAGHRTGFRCSGLPRKEKSPWKTILAGKQKNVAQRNTND